MENSKFTKKQLLLKFLLLKLNWSIRSSGVDPPLVKSWLHHYDLVHLSADIMFYFTKKKQFRISFIFIYFFYSNLFTNFQLIKSMCS